MTQSDPNDLGTLKEAKLPRRDWILLPILSLVTIALLAGSTELIARRMFSRLATSQYDCMVMNDPSTGFRGIPNSVCWGKGLESRLVEYRFNSCGHRAGKECGPKPPGSCRIVLAGSSVAMGDQVPIEETIAALLPSEITQRTGRKMDCYNEGLMAQPPATINLRFKELIAAQPDMILWVLGSWDIQHASVILPFAASPTEKGAYLRVIKRRLGEAFAAKSIPLAAYGLIETIRDIMASSRSQFLLQHVLYESQSLYVKAALMDGDGAEYLKDNLSAEWKSYLRQFEKGYVEIQGQATAAGVPLVVVLLPNRAQAALISIGKWPAGYDPYKLDTEIRSVVVRHGGAYIDIFQDFRNIPNPERHFFMDNHPNAQGHLIISSLLAKELTSGAAPAIGPEPQMAFEQKR